MPSCTCGRRGTHAPSCPVNRPVIPNRPIGFVWLWRMAHAAAYRTLGNNMKTNWKVNPLWVGLAVAAAGTAIAIEGTIFRSVPIAITGIAIAMMAPAAWVLWAVAGMFLSLRGRLWRQRPPQPTRKI